MRSDGGRGFSLGVASHLLSAMFPFLAADSVRRLGVSEASFVFYLVGAAILAALLAGRTWRAEILSAFALLLRRRCFLISIGAFAGAAICYYRGLESSSNTLEFVYLSRLDWAVQIPAAVVFLRQQWEWKPLLFSAVAALGAMCVGSLGSTGADAAWWACGYVVFSAAAYIMIVPVLEDRSVSQVGVLAVRTCFITLLLGAMCVGEWDSGRIALDSAQLWAALFSGGVLTAIFWTRFAALSRIPLWLFSGLAPLQAGTAFLVAVLRGEPPGLAAGAGIALILLGEIGVALFASRR